MGSTTTGPHHILFDTGENTQLARGIIDSLFAFVGVLTPKGALVEANEAALKRAGVTLDELRDKKLWDTYWWSHSPELQEQLRTACEQAAAGSTVRFDAVVRSSENSQVAIDFQVAPLRNRAGKVTHLVASAVDITRRKNAEDALVQADRRKDAFINALAHELRNPLAPIRNALEILTRAGSPDPRAVRAREVISRQVTHMVGLVDDLLDIARISSGRLQVNVQVFELCAVVFRTVEDYRETLEASGCSLELRLGHETLLVRADPVRVGQMLRNYLQNAQRFAAGAAVTVSCTLNAAADMVVLTVSDTGQGFSPETAARLFEPFGQADQGLGRAQGGLGLGLALTKGLAQLQGGSVAARSEGPGKGASFEIRLPHASGPSEETQAAAPVAMHLGGNHVLVVEDHKDTAETMQTLLESHGYTVVLAFEATTGLAMARMWHPEVIISDIGLPGMSGYELARALRGDPTFGSALLVAISGYADEDARRHSREAGFDIHLAKPVAPNELLKLLEKAVPGLSE